MSQGWICVHRKLLEWEWFDDHNTFRLFMYFMLKANHQDKSWKGILIKRGQHLTSLDKIVAGSGLSKSQIRTAINKLKSTREIAHDSNAQHTVITIINYDLYQASGTQVSTPVTHESHTNRTPVTPNNNDNNENNENKKSSRFTPPSLKDVIEYCKERSNGVDPQNFIDHYSANGWMRGKAKIKDWKACVRTWEKNNPTPIQQQQERKRPRGFGE